MKINVYDFDGVVTDGLLPRAGDVIITGRCIDEFGVVYGELDRVGLLGVVPVYFNPILLSARGKGSPEARRCSAEHKCRVINQLTVNGVEVDNIYEDDLLQIEIMCELLAENLRKKIIFHYSPVKK